MRFGGRLQAAIEVLGDIEQRRRPAADALKDWGLSHRFAGSGDRAAIGNLVYDTLRWRASSAWLADSETAHAGVLAMVRHRWRLSEGELETRLANDPHAPEPLAPSDLKAIATRDLALAPDHIRADVPEWLATHLEQAFGVDWLGEGAASAKRPPLDLRVNTLKADRGKVARALARFGVAETAHALQGLRIPPTTGQGRHPNLQVERSFLKGWFEIQDEGSQLAASMVLARAGEKILDLCAGAGGKSLALSASMSNTGQVFATDADRGRLAPIHDRLKRAATRNVQVRTAGRPLDDLAGRLDVVLIDAPCSGTGTWRRRPDSKWQLRPQALGERVREQSDLLATAAALVRPGARIVYETCSFLPDENARQVAAFLAVHADFRNVEGATIAAEIGLDDATAHLLEEGVLVTPGRTGTDAFFVAVLERVQT